MSFEEAIRLIQKTERGRQSRSRYQDFLANIANQAKEARRREALKAGAATTNKAEQDEECARVIQNIMRGIMARKEIHALRLEEMQFLGMMRPART